MMAPMVASKESPFQPCQRHALRKQRRDLETTWAHGVAGGSGMTAQRYLSKTGQLDRAAGALGTILKDLFCFKCEGAAPER